MTRKLKAFALALLAVAVLGAVGAQGALAHTFTSPENPGTTTLVGEGTNVVLTTGGVEIKCAKKTLHGTQEGVAASSITLTPTYDGPCTLGGAEVSVTNVADCKYVYGMTTNANGHAPVQLECEHHTKGIEIVGPGCALWLGDTHNDSSATVNQEMTGVSFTNTGTAVNGNKRDVDIKATITGMTYESSGFVCELLGIPATGHDGTTAGTFTLKGFDTVANQVGIVVDGALTDDIN